MTSPPSKAPQHSHYHLITHQVTTANGADVLAWIYLAGPNADIHDCTPIPSGDWTNRPGDGTRELTPMCGIFGTIPPASHPTPCASPV